MPLGGLVVAGTAALLPAIMKASQANKQKKMADALRQVDTTPEGQRQNLIAAQLAASSGRLPGQDVAENQITQSTSSVLDAAKKGATNGSSVLALLGRSNGQRLGALAGLNTRVQQFQQQARAGLANANSVQAGYDDRSRSEFNNAKTSLTQAADENNMSALTDVANVGAMAGGAMINKAAPATTTAAGGYAEPNLAQKLLYRRMVRKGSPAGDFSRSTTYGSMG